MTQAGDTAIARIHLPSHRREGGWRRVSASTIGGAEEQDSAHDLPSVRAEVERLFQIRDEVGHLTHVQYERYQELVEREQQLRAAEASH
jgi:hypothetical protein